MYNDQYKDTKGGGQAKPAQDGKGTGKSVSQKGQGEQKK